MSTAVAIRIRRGNWSVGRRLPARDDFPVRVVEEFVWGVYDDKGNTIFECPGVRIKVEQHTICMDRSVLDGLVT